MFETQRKALIEAENNKHLYKKWSLDLKRTEQYLQTETAKKNTLLEELHSLEKRVEQLERLSFSTLFYTVVGKKIDEIDERQQSVLTTQLKYKEAERTVEDLEKEIDEYKRNLQQLEHAKEDYEHVFEEKRLSIIQHNPELHQQLSDFELREAQLYAELNELDDVFEAGKRAASAIKDALNTIQSARNYSTYDIFFGGMIATGLKHQRMDDASHDIHKAQTALRHFQEELMDLEELTDHSLEIGNFLTFADYFFDGFIVDLTVHNRINESKLQVENMEDTVNQLLEQVLTQQEKQKSELHHVQTRYQQLVKEA